MLPLSTSGKKELSVFVLDCLDKGMDVFGESTKNVVYWNFEQRSRLKKEDIPNHMKEFSETLRGMFGAGSSNIEKRIITVMSSNCRIRVSEGEDLPSYAERVRRELLKKHQAERAEHDNKDDK